MASARNKTTVVVLFAGCWFAFPFFWLAVLIPSPWARPVILPSTPVETRGKGVPPSAEQWAAAVEWPPNVG